ncbi:MAG: AAA family ATPase [Methanobacteriaceae archaeon]|nr:AAA family ATPase [Methanobacteriaceae archaeon]
MIITIGGLAGTGTTSTTKVLSEKMDIPYLSAGDVFRQMAKDRKMTLLEFSEFAEGNNNIDYELDKKQAEIANNSENLIVEGRISAYFVEADYRIWFIAPEDIRAERICDREKEPLDKIKEEMIIRSSSEAKRYQEIHNIDINNLDIYDIIINSGTFNTEATVKIILECIKQK